MKTRLYRACDCYAVFCEHNPANRDGLATGDIVRATSAGAPLRCGSGVYDSAVILQLRPFVMVSKQGDMRWSHYHYPVEKIGKVNIFRYLYLKFKRGKK